jgi:hypothetical protein
MYPDIAKPVRSILLIYIYVLYIAHINANFMYLQNFYLVDIHLLCLVAFWDPVLNIV